MAHESKHSDARVDDATEHSMHDEPAVQDSPADGSDEIADGVEREADAKAEAAARRKAERRERAASKGKSERGDGDARGKSSQRRGGRKPTVEDKKHLQRSGNPAKRQRVKKKTLQPPTFGDWVGALRLRTLPMSIAPVAVGAGAAYNLEGFHLGIALLCLATALFLQMGVNVANDYSDGVRGTDRDRVGPKRITSSTAVDPKRVRTVALALLGLGALSGLVLTIVSQQWWLLAAGAVCLLAAWFYTGGKRPYGYYALGELVVFLVFGPVAVLGTMVAMIGRWSEDGLVLSAAMGCFAAATMLVNNLRDIDSDRASGKRTVPTLIGRVASKVLFGILMAVPYVVLGVYALAFAYGPIVMLTLLIAVPAVVIVAMARTPRDYITALGLTALTTLLYGIGVAVTFWAGVTGFILP